MNQHTTHWVDDNLIQPAELALTTVILQPSGVSDSWYYQQWKSSCSSSCKRWIICKSVKGYGLTCQRLPFIWKDLHRRLHQCTLGIAEWKNHHHPRHVNQWVKVLKFNTQMRVLNFSPHQKVGEKKLVRTEEKLIDTNDLWKDKKYR
jgi:hypothetical protein